MTYIFPYLKAAYDMRSHTFLVDYSLFYNVSQVKVYPDILNTLMDIL